MYSIGSQILSSLPQESLRLVQECRYLEGKLSCQGCTDALLSSQSSLREKKEIIQKDWDACISEASEHNSSAIYCGTNSCECIVDEDVGHGPQSRPSGNWMSSSPISGTNQTAISERYMPSLWYTISWSLLLSLHYGSHSPFQPRADNLLS